MTGKEFTMMMRSEVFIANIYHAQNLEILQSALLIERACNACPPLWQLLGTLRNYSVSFRNQRL